MSADRRTPDGKRPPRLRAPRNDPVARAAWEVGQEYDDLLQEDIDEVLRRVQRRAREINGGEAP